MSMPPMSEPLIPPLPSLGTDGFASPERQPWQLPVAQELLAQGVAPNGAFLSVICENVTKEDHQRCLRQIALWRLLQAAGVVMAFVLILTGCVLLGDGLTLFAGELFVYLSLLGVFCLGFVYLMLLGGVKRQVASRTKPGRVPALALIADRDALYHMAGDATTKVFWTRASNVRFIRGDVFLFGRWDEASGGWLYMPRRAFINEADARLFADAVRTLAKEKGDPATLPADARATFPPPYAL
ncbi:MAG: hypothetical protein H8F28_14745 [Fibrella sp.]|nr:hypothetical protein [Armatimonadota bacterium]